MRKLANKRRVVVNFVRKSPNTNETKTVLYQKPSNENRDIITIGDSYVNVNPHLSPENKDKLERLLIEFKDIFALDDRTLGKCTVDEHTVTLIDPNQIPIKHLPYKYSPALRSEINKRIKEWIDLNIIEPSCSAWSFPVVVCDKKNHST